MGYIKNRCDFTELGLKTLTCMSGDRLKEINYYKTLKSGLLRIEIEVDKPLLIVPSKIGISVVIDEDTTLVTIGEVVEEEKTANFYYRYIVEVEGVSMITDAVTTFGETTRADISQVVLLDYDHAWEKSELSDGTREYIQYFFDNSKTTNDLGEQLFDGNSMTGLNNRREFYRGTHPDFTGTMFKSINNPIIDFFHSEFINILENKSQVWLRKKAGGGIDTLTWAADEAVSYATHNPNKDDVKTTYNGTPGAITVIPDTEYYISAARKKQPVTKLFNTTLVVTDRTRIQRDNNVLMQPTMAKFIGWPQATVETLSNDGIKIKDADPFFFLKPVLDEDGNAMTVWEGDSRETYKLASFYINGVHAIPCLDKNNSNRTGQKQPLDRYYRWSSHSPIYKTNTSGTGVEWTPNMQECVGVGSSFIPGDGNEFYNCKFWRNDGDGFSPAMLIDSKQGLRFDNCEFKSIWDGYTDDYTGSVEVADALVIKNDSYDNIFRNCKFEVKTTQQEIIYSHNWNLNQSSGAIESHTYSIDNQIFGKRESRTGGLYDGGIVAANGAKPIGENQKLGFVNAVVIEHSGNIKFEGCTFKANYGQTPFKATNTDNLELLGCTSESYYHNTEVLYSKHEDFNKSTYDTSKYENAKVAYESSLSLYDVFVKIFGNEGNIISAYAAGNKPGNPYMNGMIMRVSWDTIAGANAAVLSKRTTETTFKVEEGLMPFKITEKYELKPKGYWITGQSSSVLIKGCSYYGEGIGFFLNDCTNSHYAELEDCTVDTYIDEAYLFRNVKYPKLRGCWGHTISHSVFKFESCYKPVQYNCTAESDTGFGFEFVKGAPTAELAVPYATDMWRLYDCHILSGSGLEYDPTSMPAKMDFGTYIQTANSTQDTFVLPEASGVERSLVGIKLYDAPYKATFRNLYFRGVKNDIDIYKGDNVELYLENAHFVANREIHGTYSSPAYFIHKGFSGVWEYRDIGGSITTSAVQKLKKEGDEADQSAGFSLSFKSYIDNSLGRNTIVLGNSNDETQYLNLNTGLNKITVFLMVRLLDVEKPLTNQDIWLELRYKDRPAGDPHIKTITTRGDYKNTNRIVEDLDHRGLWVIQAEQVPNAKEFKIDMIVEAGQDCSCPLSICYEYFTTVGEVYVDPYARVVQLDELGNEL